MISLTSSYHLCIKSGLGPQPAHPVNFKSLVESTGGGFVLDDSHSFIHSSLWSPLGAPMCQNQAKTLLLCPSLFSSTTSPLRVRSFKRIGLYISMTLFGALRHCRAPRALL